MPRVEADHRAGFGLPVALANRATGRCLPALERFRGQRRRARCAERERGKIGSCECFVGHEGVKNRRASRQQRDALLRQQSQRTIGTELRQDDHGPAGKHRQMQAHGHGIDVKQRRDGENALVFGPRGKNMLALTDIDGNGAVRQVDTLGLAGRAAGILQRCQRIRAGQRMWKLPCRLVAPPGQPFGGRADNDARQSPIDAGGKHDRFDVAVANDCLARRVGENGPQFAGGIGRIERNSLCTGGMHGEDGNGRVVGIAEQNSHAFAARAQADQPMREGSNATRVLRVAQRLVAADQCVLPRRPRAGVRQHVHDAWKARRQLRNRGYFGQWISAR